MSGKITLVIDAGTTGIRCIAVDEKLNHCYEKYEKIPDKYITSPHQGWVEQDPEGIWEVTRDVVQHVLGQIAVEQVRGLSLTTQRSSVLLLNQECQPVSPFIPWQDSRSSSICDEVNGSASLKAIQGGSTMLHFLSRSAKFKAGSVWTFSPIMASTKVAWLLRNDPKLHQLASEGKLLYGGLDSWLLYRLVGGDLRTDRSNLSANGLFDPWTLGASGLVSNLLNIPQQLFRDTDQPSASNWGHTPKHVFGVELPVLAVVSDQGAAVLGECCFQPGEAKITMGSGAFFSMTTGSSTSGHRGGAEVQYPWEGVYPLVAYQIKDEITFMVEGSEPACGIGLDWVGSTFRLWDDIATTADIAASVPDSQGVTFVPSLFGLRAPHNHNQSKGAFVGLTTAATRAHLIRAVLESVCWRLFEVLQCINHGTLKVKSLRINGGVSKNDFICQFLADITGLPISRAANVEATVKGAALMALISDGVIEWNEQGKEQMRQLTRKDSDHTFLPRMQQNEVQKRFLLWHDAVERVKL